MSAPPSQDTLLSTPAATQPRIDYRLKTSHLVVLLVGFIGVIFFLTHIPIVGTAIDPARFRNRWIPVDKLFHFCAYAVLMFLVLTVFATREKYDFRSFAYLKQLAMLGAVVFCYGAMDELTQPYVGRCCELGDMMADLIGILTAQFAFATAAKMGFFRILLRK